MGARRAREGAGLAFLDTLASGTAECIEYPFGRFTNGYGRARYQGRARPAHVVAYEIHVGPIPPGLEVCHDCGNRPCVNPSHLRVDTHQGNMADCLVHGTHTRGTRNGRARLTAEQVANVRAEVAAGTRQIDLAASLEVSPQTINHIVRGRTWASQADEIRMVAD